MIKPEELEQDELEVEEKIEASKDRARASLALEIPVTPIQNKIRVVVLQHPQEPDKVLGSAALLVRCLENSQLKVGLSWRSLSKVLGREVQASNWGVLYLGAKGQAYPQAVNFVNKKSLPVPAPSHLEGIIVLDGTWSQVKALWWRNSWLLKLKRIVLQPESPSQYGNLRKEPRREAVSTMESVALALGNLEPEGAPVKQYLDDTFALMLSTYKERRKKSNHPSAKP